MKWPVIIIACIISIVALVSSIDEEAVSIWSYGFFNSPKNLTNLNLSNLNTTNIDIADNITMYSSNETEFKCSVANNGNFNCT